MPPQLGLKNVLKQEFEILFSFEKGIFKMKWPKTEEKLEFGGKLFSGGGVSAPPPHLSLIIVPTPLQITPPYPIE